MCNTPIKTWADLVSEIRETFRKWKIVEWGLNPIKAPQRRDRYHTYGQRLVAVRYFYHGKFITLSENREDLAHDNLQRLAVALETLRLSDVRNISVLIASHYTQQAPAPKPPSSPPPPPKDTSDPYIILGVERKYPLPVIETIWKARLRVEHPDVGGSAERTVILNVAMDKIRKDKS